MVEQLSEHLKAKSKWTVIRTSQISKYVPMGSCPGFTRLMKLASRQVFEISKTQVKITSGRCLNYQRLR